jgi:DNA-binding SARP family transcriptional activator/tetratricopeptide (TPR) repeat protein
MCMDAGAIMQFRLLGPVELWSEEKQIDVGSVKARCALAVLLLNLGIVVSSEALADRVWDGNPPPKAQAGLSVYITRLRRVLRQATGDRVRLVAQAHGYELEADPGDVDLHNFRRLRREANRLAARGDRESASALLREADSLWRGEALAGLPGVSMARVRQGLEEERRGAILERIDLDLTLGRHLELLAELQRLSDEYPMDEALAASQMIALCRSGRQSDALRVYRDTRELLAGEQGTEPGLALSELHNRILHNDPQLSAVPTIYPVTDNLIPSDTLPPKLTEFVGREQEMALLTSDYGRHPVAQVVTGMPGVGKTALAAHAARAMAGHYPGGQLFLSFCTHDPRNPPLDPEVALHRLLRMLNVPPGRIPQTLAERATLWRAELARRRLIVVLDDVAGVDQVRALLPTAGECRTLITSRVRLEGLDEDTTVGLNSLPEDDATELFTRIAGPAATDMSQVSEAIRLCGGLPLAIQMIAHGLRQGHPATLGGLIEELSSPTVRLAGESGLHPEVTAVFDLSYRTLPTVVQELFRRLGLHPGTEITAHAAAALGGRSLAEAEATLAALANRHLLEDAGESFHFHDLMRQYAVACALGQESRREQRQVYDRLIDYYLNTVRLADQLLYGDSRATARWRVNLQAPAARHVLGTPRQAADWMELEWRNILATARCAAEHERKPECADLVHTMARFLEASGHWNEAFSAHALALQASLDLGNAPGIAAASLDLSLVAGRAGHRQEAIRHAERAAASYKSLADLSGEARALDQIGTLNRFWSRFREALAYHQEANNLYRSAGDSSGVASTLSHIGIAHYHLGRYDSSIEHLRSALRIYRELRDPRGEAKILNNLGNMQRYQGYHRDALDSYRKALEIFQVIGGEQNQAKLYENIGCIQHYKKDYEEALVSYRRALAIYRCIGDRPDEAGILNEVGVTLNAMEHHDGAFAHHDRALHIAGELGDSYERVIALRGMADAYRGRGMHDEAFERYQQALHLAREISEPYQEGKVLEGMGETVLQTLGPGAARICWRQALDIYQQLNVPEAETMRIRLDVLPPRTSEAST